jgi:tripartite-type tricarboxylate transporter receptor subunit TctC
MAHSSDKQPVHLKRRPVLALMAASLAVPLRAQTAWPDKPLRIVVPFVPGGPPDTVSRLILPKLSELLGQPIIVDNRGGAGGNIGSQIVAKAPPDGNTILITSSAFAVNTNFPESGYNAERDFIPVTIVANQPNVIISHPSLPVRSIPELLAAARATPMAFATPGSGTTPHLTAENLFNLTAKLNMTPIHYRGAGQAVGAVVAGEPKVGCLAMTAPMQNIKSGKLNALAVTSAKRLAVLPDVPTLVELGYPDMLDYTWVGAFLPTGTPAAIQNKWYDALSKALAQPEVKEKIQALAFESIADTPARTSEYVKAEIQRWGQVVRRTNIKPE